MGTVNPHLLYNLEEFLVYENSEASGRDSVHPAQPGDFPSTLMDFAGISYLSTHDRA